MAKKQVVVAAHGHCFDGLASAALFSHLRQTLGRSDGRAKQSPYAFRYRSCGYGPKFQTVPEHWLHGVENAIVDFRFTRSERLTWYFDHHPTAFASPAEEEEALAHARGRYFHDASKGSCAKLIAEIGRSKYGANFDRHEELLTWAHRIDSASFSSADDALSKADPAKQLAAVVEQRGDTKFYQEYVPLLLERGLEEVATCDAIQHAFAPIEAALDETLAIVRERTQPNGRVSVSDLENVSLRASAKFMAYAVLPTCVYSVALTRNRDHLKISIGFNPWANVERTHDIGELCQRYGGGGHPVVGAFALPGDDLETARKAVSTIVDLLNDVAATPS